MSEPLSTECANADERFTCPGCYSDLPFKYGSQTCGECKRDVNCRREMIPSYVATLAEEHEDEDEFEEDEDNDEDDEED